MVLDGLTLYSSVMELKPILNDAKVTKINMPAKEEIVFTLFTKSSGNIKLNISAAGDASAVFTGDMKKNNPKTPPAFCMLLRKYLSNAHIKDILIKDMDRTFEILFESKDEMLHPVTVSLICELMGKYSNIILINENRKIMDAVKRISVDVSSLRQVLPGASYNVPPQQQTDILKLSSEEIFGMLESQDEETPSHYLTKTFSGFSKKTAEEILFRSGIEDIPLGKIQIGEKIRLSNAIRVFFDEALSSPVPSVQINGDGTPVFVSVLPFDTYPKDLRKEFPTVNEALFWFYFRRHEIFILKQRKDYIKKQLNRKLSKTNKKIRILEEGIADASKAEALISKANIITANIYRLKKGMNSLEATDPMTGEEVKITLDVSLHPAQNAQKIYKKAAKMKVTREIYSERLKKALDEKEFIESSILFADKSESLDDTAELESLLADEQIISGTKTKKKEISEPREYHSPSGFRILVGRNDKQNDRLTMGIAKKDDIWFHAQKMPGAHVLLVTEGKPIDEIDDATVEFAARLAAEYSSAKLGGKIPVDYTFRSNIKKPPASRPGRVTYEHYWTIYTEK